MKTEFRKALIPDELRRLYDFDRKVFPCDHFPASMWRHYESWWLLIDGRPVGCCAFELDADFTEDIDLSQLNKPRPNSLYIASTGILPKFQRQGLGQLFKTWQIAWARRHGFTRIVTNTRKRNKTMIALNQKFGFQIIRTTPRYYRDPTDATVVLELLL